MHEIIGRAKIEDEARTAARSHSNVNDCCPYPFNSAAGALYASEFKQERDWLAHAKQVKPQARA